MAGDKAPNGYNITFGRYTRFLRYWGFQLKSSCRSTAPTPAAMEAPQPSPMPIFPWKGGAIIWGLAPVVPNIIICSFLASTLYVSLAIMRDPDNFPGEIVR
jgi:hypothetical protein